MDKVVHFEIPADDMNRATSFYKMLFGWKIEQFGNDMYMVSTTPTDERGMPTEPGGINGDISPRKDTFKNPVIVIDVANLDERLKQAVKHGGKVIEPKRQIADMGLYARISDTEGNIIGIWQDLK